VKCTKHTHYHLGGKTVQYISVLQPKNWRTSLPRSLRLLRLWAAYYHNVIINSSFTVLLRQLQATSVALWRVNLHLPEVTDLLVGGHTNRSSNYLSQ